MTVNEQIAIEHGLKKDEYEKICKLLNRIPNITELGIFSAMWNEHCSYKSSRLHLKNLPTKGKQVIQGPGENAGLDPNNLPEADKSSMNFGSGGNTDAKAWKDIWGSGQGIGSIKDSPSVQTLVNQLTEEFKEAVKDLNQKSTY